VRHALLILSLFGSSFADPFFRFHLRPAFLPPDVIFHFSEDHGSGTLIVTRYSTNLASEDRFPVPATVLQNLRSRLASADTMANLGKEECGGNPPRVDGVVLDGYYESQDRHVDFRFCSPERDRCSRNYFISRAAFEALGETGIPDNLTEYLEQAALYFDFGTPIKTEMDSAYHVKVLRLAMQDSTAFDKALTGRPAGKKMILDFTNFSTLGTYFHPLLKVLGKAKDVAWTADGKTGKLLRDIGIASIEVVPKRRAIDP
jgi:hypothetical protein